MTGWRDIASAPRDALPPCPFCGSSAHLFYDRSERFGDEGPTWVICDGCGATEPIHVWNRRVLAMPPREPTETMVEAGRKAMSPEKFVSHARALWVWQDMWDAALPLPPTNGANNEG